MHSGHGDGAAGQSGGTMQASQAPPHRPDASTAADASAAAGSRTILATTWNIAAVNNNPFEYWVTHDDPAYNELMAGVQDFIDNPGMRDVKVSEVLTDDMFEQLLSDLQDHEFQDLDRLRRFWAEEYKERKLVSGFLKDKLIGGKRLASMPDRITNTIHAAGGQIFCRPTPINCYEGEFESKDQWWAQWRNFMFHTSVQVLGKNGSPCAPKLVCHLLEKIPRARYPDITEEEEAHSLGLQTMCLAVFDAILFHILDSVASSAWQPLRKSICDALYRNKEQQILTILTTTYPTAAVVFLQEVAASFVEKFKAREMHDSYFVLIPAQMDGIRDQNSIILASRAEFVEDSARDVTEEILSVVPRIAATLPPKVSAKMEKGDLVAATIQGTDGNRYLLVSFHGDTNGLATRPVVAAVDEIARDKYKDHILVFGLDANTYREHTQHYQGVMNFHEFISERGLGSCWGGHPDPMNATTCNARTYLQPQLNKAVGREDRVARADKNLKDWIIFYSNQTSAADPAKDNTGGRRYTEEMVFPTLDFPSDHAVVSAQLTDRKSVV